MKPRPLSEPQFALAAAVVLVALAVIGSTIMTAVGMNAAQVGGIIVPTMGFAGLIFTQYRASSIAAGKVEEVRTDLRIADDRSNYQLAEIQATGKATHSLVNSGHLAALRSNALLSGRIAELTGNVDDRAIADRSAVALRDHEARQSIVDREQAKNRSEGKPEA